MKVWVTAPVKLLRPVQVLVEGTKDVEWIVEEESRTPEHL
jgi:hypothetical protein